MQKPLKIGPKGTPIQSKQYSYKIYTGLNVVGAGGLVNSNQGQCHIQSKFNEFFYCVIILLFQRLIKQKLNDFIKQ